MIGKYKGMEWMVFNFPKDGDQNTPENIGYIIKNDKPVKQVKFPLSKDKKEIMQRAIDEILDERATAIRAIRKNKQKKGEGSQ